MNKLISLTFSISDFFAWLICLSLFLYAFLNPFILSSTETLFGEKISLEFKWIYTPLIIIFSGIFFGIAKRKLIFAIIGTIFSCLLAHLLLPISEFTFTTITIAMIFLVPYFLSYIEFKTDKTQQHIRQHKQN